MRSAIGLACLALCACSTVPVVHGVTPGHVCNADGTAGFIGQTASQESGNAIIQATHAAVLRWAAPGVMLTMDFRQDRVTVRTGPDGRITAINCG